MIYISVKIGKEYLTLKLIIPDHIRIEHKATPNDNHPTNEKLKRKEYPNRYQVLSITYKLTLSILDSQISSLSNKNLTLEYRQGLKLSKPCVAGKFDLTF